MEVYILGLITYKLNICMLHSYFICKHLKKIFTIRLNF